MVGLNVIVGDEDRVGAGVGRSVEIDDENEVDVDKAVVGDWVGDLVGAGVGDFDGDSVGGGVDARATASMRLYSFFEQCFVFLQAMWASSYLQSFLQHFFLLQTGSKTISPPSFSCSLLHLFLHFFLVGFVEEASHRLMHVWHCSLMPSMAATTPWSRKGEHKSSSSRTRMFLQRWAIIFGKYSCCYRIW